MMSVRAAPALVLLPHCQFGDTTAADWVGQLQEVIYLGVTLEFLLRGSALCGHPADLYRLLLTSLGLMLYLIVWSTGSLRSSGSSGSARSAGSLRSLHTFGVDSPKCPIFFTHLGGVN